MLNRHILKFILCLKFEREHGSMINVYDKPMLLRICKNIVAPVSDLPKIHYFWRIQHTPVRNFEESEPT